MKKPNKLFPSAQQEGEMLGCKDYCSITMLRHCVIASELNVIAIFYIGEHRYRYSFHQYKYYYCAIKHA